MDFEKVLKFATQYLSEYLSVAISTFIKPVNRFQPKPHMQEGQQSIILGSRKNLEIINGPQFNPKLFGFVVISIFIGYTIRTLIPDRRSSPDFITSVIVIVIFWILSGTMIHIFCKILQGKGSYLETLSVSLQVYSVLYVISGVLTLAVSMILGIPLISNAASQVGGFAEWIVKKPVYSIFGIHALLYIVYLPLSLHYVHHFGWIRQILLSSAFLVFAILGTMFGVAVYEQIGLMIQMIEKADP